MFRPVREAVTVWAAIIAGLAAAYVAGMAVPLLHGAAGALAVGAFLYVPMRMLERRGEDARDAGWRFDGTGRDLLWALGACAVVLPPFTAAFWSSPSWMDRLPHALYALVAPYAQRIQHGPRVPMTLEFAGQVAGNAAVAVSEEFFYRGYMTRRFEQRMRPVPAALLAAALFAVGHLLTPAPWRLLVFFPALVFAWLRKRTGTIVAPAICHFVFNVWLLMLSV